MRQVINTGADGGYLTDIYVDDTPDRDGTIKFRRPIDSGSDGLTATASGHEVNEHIGCRIA